jgi:hypothetical protein
MAIGDYSHAEGWSAITSGMASHAEGYHTIANGDSSHVSGQYNTTNANYSEILGGSGNTTSTSAIGSAVIASSGITATQPYALYTNKIILKITETPFGSGDERGETGSIAWDGSYFYWKTALGWRRATGSTF